MTLTRHLPRFPLLVLMGLTALAGPFVSRACAAPDPVEQLKQVLALPKLLDDLDFLKRRNDQIKAIIADLHTIPQLRRAYFLPGWGSTIIELDPLTKKEELNPQQVEIGNKLVAAIRKAKQQATAGRASPSEAVQQAAQVKLLAVAMLLAELADAEPPTERKRDKLARKLTDVAVELSGDPNAAVKQTALHALGKITPPPAQAFKVLGPAVRNGQEPGPRRIAAYALLDLLKNSNSITRREQAHTIQGVLETAKAGLDDAAAEEVVRGYSLMAIRDAAKSLDDWSQGTDIADMASAAELRKALADCESVSPSLGKVLSAPSANIRVAAIDALVQLAQLRAKLWPRIQDKNGLPDPLGGAGLNDRINDVRALLAQRDGDARQRRGALAFLDLLQSHAIAALPEITMAMHDPDNLVRYAAARTIRHFPAGDKKPSPVKVETIEALGRLLLDVDPDVNSAAATSLEGLGTQAGAAIESLSKAVNYGDSENRVAAIKLIGHLGTPTALRAYPAVIEALGNEEPRVTRQAAETLGQMGALAQKNDATTDAALRSLIDGLRAAAVPALVRSLRDGDAETRLNASEAILTMEPAGKGL